jgi:hypothetical protein
VIDVSFSGVSTQYIVEVPRLGSMVCFAQNMVFGPVANLGAQVWLSWKVDHGFGLADVAEQAGAKQIGTAEDLTALDSEAVV